MNATSIIVALSLALSSVTACRARESAPNASPLVVLSAADGAGSVLDGRVIERIDAGPYRYLLVRTAASDEWIVSLATDARVGSNVRATVLARATRYASRRLRRTFDRLAFATVREERVAEIHR